MRIASWNINSIRIRLPLIAQLMHTHPVDILCLQETKVTNDLFPEKALAELGFAHCYYHGEKSYNGVAILSNIPLANIHSEYFIPTHTRHIGARLPNGIMLHNVYVPAGGDIPDAQENPKFADKLHFLAAMRTWSESQITPDTPAILVGDMNIAPLEHDVWSHKQLLDVVSHTPIEVEQLQALQAASGWIDTAREFVDISEKLYSWWSYRARDWLASNRGRRLDHIWITKALHTSLKSVTILHDARGWEKPSDHVPVIMELKN